MSLARLRKKKNIAVVVGPHKLLSIRSICQMENTFVDSIDSFDLSNGEYSYSIGKVQLTIGLLHLIS